MLAGLAAIAAVLATELAFKLMSGHTAPGNQAMQTLKIGEASVIRLQGNPSTGYIWTLNAAASKHLALVTVEDLGYAGAPPPKPDEPPIVGAPEEQSFRVTAKAAGTAKVAFDYVRPWEGEAVQHQVFNIEVRGE